MLRVALANDPQCAIAATDQGLFLEIAEECRAAYPAGVRLSFLCGRDAAERIAGWDYGRPGAFGEMLRKFDLLVAARRGEYQPAPEVRQAVERLPLPAEFEEVSSSAVRGRIARGEPWQHLVPPPIREMAERIYGRPESVLGR
jgi:nicotinic acid mononucleotide adenylyltransferase